MWKGNEKISRQNDCPWQILEDKILILKPERSMAHELNATGSWVWQKLSDDPSYADLIADFCSEYEVLPATAEQDITTLLDNLKGQGLIEC